MPYIKCPDGNIYSRYDNSEYVTWCKCNESRINDSINTIRKLQYDKCTLDPNCLEKRNNLEFKENCNLLIISIIIILLSYKITKSFLI